MTPNEMRQLGKQLVDAKRDKDQQTFDTLQEQLAQKYEDNIIGMSRESTIQFQHLINLQF
jgi:hypothetical protein